MSLTGRPGKPGWARLTGLLLACAALVGCGPDDPEGPPTVVTCDPYPCGTETVCVPLADGHRCECKPGFTGDPATACVATPVETCATHTCGAHATCSDAAAGPSCACAAGFEGDADAGCTDIDACVRHACGAHASCTDAPAPAAGDVRTCACDAGFEGNGTAGCTEIDACAAAFCGPNAVCTDAPAPADGAAHTCACKPGYAGDGTNCADLDACLANPCGLHAACSDLPAPALGDPSGRTCACDLGFVGDAVAGCLDIDACLANPCPAQATCSDLPGPALGGPDGRTCTCEHGLTLGDGVCGPIIRILGLPEDGPLMTSAGGGLAPFQVALAQAPTGAVTIVLSSSDTTEGTVTPTVLHFDADHWDVPKTVTVTGVDDHSDNPAYTIVTGPAASTDPAYAGVDAADVTAQNLTGPEVYLVPLPTGGDGGDAPAATIADGLVTSEDGGTAQLTFVLGFPPTSDVTFTFVSSDPTLGTLSTTTVVFTPENWNSPQTVTVTGLDSPGADADPTYSIAVVVTSDDPAYDGLPVAPIVVTNVDDESPGVRVSPVSGLETSETGGTATFTIALNAAPQADVSIALATSDPKAGSAAWDGLASVTFTPDDWRVPKTVTVTGVDDPTRSVDVAYQIVTGPVVSADVRYAGMVVADVAVTNLDRTTPGISVSPTRGLVTAESGQRASFTVVLNSAPSAEVQVPIHSGDAAEGLILLSDGVVAETTLVFTAANWNARQTVTVIGVADPLHALDGNRAYRIVTAPAVSDDPRYGGDASHAVIDAADVEVVNRDGDSPGLVLGYAAPLVTTEGGGTASFTVALAARPEVAITVTSTSSDGGEGTAAPEALTFTPDDWDRPQTVTITGQADPEGPTADSDVPYRIAVQVTGGDDLYRALGPELVAVTNLDFARARIIVTPLDSPMRTSESGRQARFSIALSRAPTAAITVALAASAPTEGTLSAASVTFAPEDGDATRVITITGVDDGTGPGFADGLQDNPIRIGPTTGLDAAYAALPVTWLFSDNVDNDGGVVLGCAAGESGDELVGCSDIDACVAHACGAHAACTDLAAPAAGDATGRTCACDIGFEGDALTGCTELNACAANACAAHATCTDLVAPALGYTCACDAGFEGVGATACTDINACAANACGGHATCTDLAAPALGDAAGRTCSCNAGFEGNALTGCTDINACAANACGGHATCTDLAAPALGNAAGRTCACDAGFEGNALTGCTDINACAANACGAHAACTDLAAPALGNAAGRTCACDAGFEGNALTGCTDINACAANACGGHATCTDLAAPALGNAAGRTCACDAGFEGNALTGCTDINACAANACGGHATCTDLAAPALGNAAGRTCACDAGFEGNALTGCTDINACVANACGGNATCTDLTAPALGNAAGRTCACDAGFEGNALTGCTDINACAASACGNNATCTDLAAPALGNSAGRTCACDAGFEGNALTGCTDINACAANACGNNATCTDLAAPALGNAAGRTCACDAGFEGNALTGCTDINACVANACGGNATCTDLAAPALGNAAGRTCACDAGFDGNALTGCTDINACAANACGSNAICTDLAAPALGNAGGRTCACDAGFEGNAVTGCTDINACVANACGGNATCTDLAAPALGNSAGRTCACDAGFEGNALTACTDINACAANACGSNATCTDLAAPALGDAAGRTCACSPGFEGNALTACSDINACATNACGTNATCTDLAAPALGNAAGRTCACDAGFEGDALTACTDINACNTNACGANATCTDLAPPALADANGRTCACNLGFSGDALAGCTDTDACVSSPCAGTATCSDKPAPAGGNATGRTCSCPGGYDYVEGSGCVDTDECTRGLANCGAHTTCENLVGSYACHCAEGSIDVNGDATDCAGVAQMAAGDQHTCTITDHGTLYCWGSNASGQLGDGTVVMRPRPVQVGNASDWTEVSLGSSHTCGRHAGALYCWGNNAQGQLGDGTTTNHAAPVKIGANDDWSELSAGDYHTCGRRAGALYCWGNNTSGQLGDGTQTLRTTPVQIGVATDWSELDAGSGHTCGRRAGSLYCWGSNSAGQLGDGTTNYHPSPVLVGTNTDWSEISAGGIHTCGRRAGALYCWGYNQFGQVGDGTATNRTSPVQVGAATDWSEVTTGTMHTCGRRAGVLYCWGYNPLGQLGDGTTNNHSSPVQVGALSDWASISAGSQFTCARRGASIYCWGNGGTGSLGDGIATTVPSQVGSNSDWSQLGTGDFHSCGLRGGALYCWGYNGYGQIGDGTTTMRPRPVQVGIQNDWTELSVGANHTCGRRGGALYCWGANFSGQLGLGPQWNATTPTQVGTATDWSEVSAGYGHTCGRRGGALFCWGDGADGAVGDGTNTQRTNPVQIGTDTDWSELSAGYRYTCGRRNGALYCWGDNGQGKLGDGTTTNRLSPVQVGTDSDWSEVSAGSDGTCGRRGAKLYCWGDNTYGQLGVGDRTNRTSPIRVGTDSDWSEVSRGTSYSCGRRAGALYCWGKDSDGRLGNGNDGATSQLLPGPVGTNTDWVEVSAGNGQTCGRRGAGGGSLYCWGESALGKLGLGTTWSPPAQPVSFSLLCPSGFYRNPVDPALGCVDADACLSSACGTNATCTDLAAPALENAAGRTCTCNSGFDGNGADLITGCTDLNACLTTRCSGTATCSDLPAPALGDAAGRACACPVGYQYAEGQGCIDANECQTASNPCGAGSVCTNTVGTYTCACDTGTLDVHGDGRGCLTVAKLSTGAQHACAVLTNGALYCWGDAALGVELTGIQRPSPTQVGVATDWTDVAASDYHTCGIRGGVLYCWGVNQDGRLGDGTTTQHAAPTQVGTATDWLQVVAGPDNTCGRRAAAGSTSLGELYCWGANASGQLGNGTTATALDPVRVGAASDWVDITTDDAHTCGRRGTGGGELYCWGKSSAGQVGDGTFNTRLSPVRIGTASDWAEVDTGFDATCGRRGAGVLFCWGRDAAGSIKNVPTQVGAATDWIDVDVGGSSVCGRRGALGPLAGGGLYCWGNGSLGQLGNGTNTSQTTPTQVGAATDWTLVSVGYYYACGRHAGAFECWGRNNTGQLGRDYFEKFLTPAPLSPDTGWTQVSAGNGHTCALRGGTLACGGFNTSGQLGLGTTTAQSPLTQVGSLSDWTQVSAGAEFTCARRADPGGGTLACWGRNDSGQLGDGTTTNRTSPVQVGVATDWSSISAGPQHACGVRAGALYCWGDNANGQLGDGSTTGRSSPVRVGTNSDWVAVSAGAGVTCGLRGGDLYCWGSNHQGQLGDGSATGGVFYRPRTTPGRVGTDSDWSEIAVGEGSTCGRRGGVLYCWGANSVGQLGDGTNTDRTTVGPAIGTATTWSGLELGGPTSCGLRGPLGAQALYCWGANENGELGNGTTTAASTPTRVGSSTWTNVSANYNHTAGIQAGRLYGWGLTSTLGVNTWSPGLVPAGSFCPLGYGYDATAGTCVDRDACAVAACPGDGIVCTDLPAPAEANASGRTCACPAGFEGNTTIGCTEINACLVAACGANATCTDLPAPALGDASGRTCACNAGFGGNADTGCSDLDACLTSPCTGVATCSDLPAPALANPAGRTCDCPIGYDYIEGSGCIDIDECTEGTDTCPNAATCNNTVGAYTCTCNDGTLDVLGDGSQCATTTVLSAGIGHTCAITTQGKLYCWGANGNGQLGDGTATARGRPTQIGAASDWVDVEAGNGQTCGRRAQAGGGSTLWCWGYNGHATLGDGTFTTRTTPTQIGTATDWSEIALGGLHGCGRRGVPGVGAGSTLWCWGYNDQGQVGDGTQNTDRPTPLQIGAATDWKQLDLGDSHTCGRRGPAATGTLWCWGANGNGQLGDGTSQARLTPVQIGAQTDWTDVSAGIGHTCGRRGEPGVGAGSTLWCWGSNSDGRLGDGTNQAKTSPVQVGAQTDWAQVSAGGAHTCGRSGAGGGQLACWGSNDQGQLGESTAVTQRLTPTVVGVATNWSWVAVGGAHTCALRDGAVQCWGRNLDGQLGDGGFKLANPTAVTVGGSGTGWFGLDAGKTHTCALRGTGGVGTLWCWGINDQGQLGDGTTINRASPVQVGTAADWTEVSANGSNTCGRRGGALYCWGRNDLGIVGDGTTTNRSAPVLVSGGFSDWAQVAVGTYHVCARRGAASGTLYCWGNNSSGQLGVGDTTTRTSPVQVGAQTDWLDVDGNTYQTCGRRGAGATGTLWCWGTNDYGQLGVTTPAQSSTPVQVGTASDWLSVTTGDLDTFGRRSQSGGVTLWGWGYNGNSTNLLADDSGVLTRSTPAQAGVARDWANISAGGFHNCGLRAGALWCWGSNASGQLGDGTTTQPARPIRIGTASDWTRVSASGSRTCGLRGTALYCWGDNAGGAAGVGATSTPHVVHFAGACPAGLVGDTATGCECPSGTTSAPGGGCVDIDECAAALPACGELATCSNNPGNYECTCGAGTTDPRGDGSVCGPIVVAGGYATCALFGPTVKCWGRNTDGQLGLGDTASRGDAPGEMGASLPAVALGTGRTAVELSAGDTHACARLDNGSVKCWGLNSSGQLGLGSLLNRGDNPFEMGDNLPAIALGSGRTAVAISAGLNFTCAILDNGSLKCWGGNSFGQLGLGDVTGRGTGAGQMGDSLPAVALGTGRTAVAIGAGGWHACALLDDATVKCWGFNLYGQLGRGDTLNRGDAAGQMGDALAPVDLGTGRTAIAIAIGGYHSCAILDDETVKCWGNNGNGVLGIGTSVNMGDNAGEMGDALPPVNLGTGRTAVALSLGSGTCAHLDNDTVKCWGYANFGQLGLGNTTPLGYEPNHLGDNLPAIAFGTGRTVGSLARSNYARHGCVVLDTGKIKCWGYNADGQLGLGDTNNRGDQTNEMGDNLPAVSF